VSCRDVRAFQRIILLVEAVESGELSPYRREEAGKVARMLKCSRREAYRYLALIRELDGLYRRVMERRLGRIAGV